MFKRGSRRASVAVLAVIFVGALGACGKGTSGTPTATASTATASAPAPSAKPSASAPATVQVLGPIGYGALKLGQTPAQAEATNLITPLIGTAEGCDRYAHLAGSPATGRENISGRLFFSEKLGLAAIYAFPGVKTPEGVQLDTTFAQMRKAYPSWKSASDSGDEGRGYVKVPGNANAVYRIEIANGKVIQLSLQLVNQDCYE